MTAQPSAANRNLLVIVGYGGANPDSVPEWDRLAAAISTHLNIPVQPAFVDVSSPSVGTGIQRGVTEHRPPRTIVLPMFIGANAAKQKNVRDILQAATERWTDTAIFYGQPLGTHTGVIAAFSQLITAALQIASADIPADETALLVVGRGSRDADSNAHVYQMARHLWETTRLGSLDICFHGVTKPDLAAGIQRCLQTGARRIVIVPYLLYDIALYRTLEHQVNQLRATTAADLILTAPLGIHDGILEAVSQRYDEALSALADALWDVPAERSAWNALYSYSTHSHGTNGSHTHNAQSILPPRYQGDVTVSAEPMSAADLIFDAEGKVAWNEIWGGFCDLALAGGPPHRGTLLEPATPEQVRSAPDDYQRVLAELERGLKMVTNLPVISSAAAGWIGLQCTDDAMAIWLLRAILVENVSVRREDNILYLPAGPYFLLHKEIKNVITVVAKTHHYWLEHLNGTSS